MLGSPSGGVIVRSDNVTAGAVRFAWDEGSKAGPGLQFAGVPTTRWSPNPEPDASEGTDGSHLGFQSIQ